MWDRFKAAKKKESRIILFDTDRQHDGWSCRKEQQDGTLPRTDENLFSLKVPASCASRAR